MTPSPLFPLLSCPIKGIKEIFLRVLPWMLLPKRFPLVFWGRDEGLSLIGKFPWFSPCSNWSCHDFLGLFGGWGCNTLKIFAIVDSPKEYPLKGHRKFILVFTSFKSKEFANYWYQWGSNGRRWKLSTPSWAREGAARSYEFVLAACSRLETEGFFRKKIVPKVGRASWAVVTLMGCSFCQPSIADIEKDLSKRDGAPITVERVGSRCLKGYFKFGTLELELGLCPKTLHFSMKWASRGEITRVT